MQISVNQDYSETIDYIIPQFPIYIRKGSLSEYYNFSAVSHWHEDIEFIYILSGEMQYDINGTVVTLHEQEGIMVNSRNFHYGYSEKQQECEFLCIIIHPSLFTSNTYLTDHFVEPFVECNALPYIVLSKQPWHRDICKILLSLYELDQGSDIFYLQCQILASNLFYMLYQGTKDIIRLETHTTDHTLVQLRKMVKYIQQHYSETLTLANIAAIGGMGKTSCTTAFKTYMHTTPIDYLLAYRMSKSVALLTQTTRSITEIAYEVGFHDSSYYTKYFKKYYGITPRKMRARGAQMTQN